MKTINELNKYSYYVIRDLCDYLYVSLFYSDKSGTKLVNKKATDYKIYNHQIDFNFFEVLPFLTYNLLLRDKALLYFDIKTDDQNNKVIAFYAVREDYKIKGKDIYINNKKISQDDLVKYVVILPSKMIKSKRIKKKLKILSKVNTIATTDISLVQFLHVDFKGYEEEIKLFALKETKEIGGLIGREQDTLNLTGYYAYMRELRKKMYMEKNTLGIHKNSENNLEICKRLINLRREIAQLLGYKTFADYIMRHRMAEKTDNVYKLLDDLIDAYKPAALKEVNEINTLAKRTEGNDFKMEPWDFSFYSHKLQMEKYNLDSEMLRPYFELSKVIKGVFGLATRLYGITFKENKNIPVYHDDVKAYEVFDKDNSYLAVLYADFFPRKGKQGGAWMTEFQGQWIDKHGVNVRPHVSLVMNFTKPTEEKPALLTLGEVETFLHEFGHALHGMFANTRFESLSGTNVWWDFVELPSQFMENFAVEKSSPIITR